MKTSKKSIQRRKKAVALPVWDFHVDGVTSSLLRTFLTCREQTYLKYIEGWQQPGIREPIEFGWIFHNALEHLAAGKDPVRSVTAYVTKRSKGLTAGDQQTLNRLAGMAKAMIPLYIEYWAKYDKLKITEWVEHESVFDQQVSVPGHAGDIRLRGRRDGAFTSGKKGAFLWLFETKTKGVIPEQTLLNVLPFDTQVMLYSYVLGLEYDQKVAGVIYNVIRRPGLRIRKDDTLKKFCDRVKDDVHARPEHYFMRWQVQFDADEIETWVQFKLNHLLMEMVEWIARLEDATDHFKFPERRWNARNHYINDNSLHGAYGPCDLFSAITQGNYVGLEQSSTVFQELED